MKICKTYEVKFTGKMASLNTPTPVPYWIVKDDGERFQAQVPNHPKIRESFEWMSDNDCLRHLEHVSPSYSHNALEVEAVEHYNAMLQENAYALASSSKTYCVKTGQMIYNIPGIKKVPERTFEVKWTFWSREHAVMFKLACGGSLED